MAWIVLRDISPIPLWYRSPHPTRAFTDQAYLGDGLSSVCVTPLSFNQLLHAQEDLTVHTEENHHKPDPVANLH